MLSNRMNAFFLILFLFSINVHGHFRVKDPEKINVMLFGASSVGKTCLAERLAGFKFNFRTSSTIGGDSFVLKMTRNGKKVEFILWDTAGQERFAQMSQFYYRKADIAVIVYSVNDQSTFEYAKSSLKRLNEYNLGMPPTILIGAKSDLQENYRKGWPLSARAHSYASQNEIDHAKVSALDGFNIDYLLDWLVEKVTTVGRAKRTENYDFESPTIISLDETYLRMRNADRYNTDDSCCQ